MLVLVLLGAIACEGGRHTARLEVNPPLVVSGRAVAPREVQLYLEVRAVPPHVNERCAYLPLAQRDDVAVLNMLCWHLQREGDSLVADSSGRAAALVVRLAVVHDSGKIVSHAFLDSPASDSLVRAFSRAQLQEWREAPRDSVTQRLLFERLREDVETDFGLRPDPRDSLRVQAAADWPMRYDTVSHIELRAPSGWLSPGWRVEGRCTPAAMPTDSSVLGKNDKSGAPYPSSLTAAMQRGTTAAALQANGFAIGPYGVGIGGSAMFAGNLVRHGGGRWIAMAGDYWFGIAMEGGGYAHESAPILVAVVDVGDGCKLVWAAAGEEGGSELPSLDTLAAVLVTVRRR